MKQLVLHTLLASSLLLTQAFAVAAAAAPDRDATPLLHAAIEAQGGEGKLRALRVAEWKLYGYRDMIEESERPEGPYIKEYQATTQIHDYAHDRFLSTSDSTVYPVFKFSSGLVAADGVAMRIQNGAKRAGTREQLQVAHEQLLLSPERLLLTALDAKDVQREADTVLQSVPQNVVTFTLDDAPVRIFLNAYTHLPTAVDYSGPMAHAGFWAYLGDVTSRTLYGFWWLAKGGIHLPMQWTVEGNGLPDRTLSASILKMDDALDESQFEIPSEVRQQFAQAPARRSPDDLPLGNASEPEREIAPGVFLIPGAWNVSLIRQDDGIVVLEAPISSGYSRKVLTEAHRLFPSLPIKAVITTSDAWPHLSGIREYVAEGVPIYALDLNRPILARVIGASYASKPDSLQRKPRAPRFRLVSGAVRLDSKLNPLILMPIRGQTSERQIMVYFSGQKLLYGSDVFQQNGDSSYNLPQTVDELLQAVKREHLDVSQYFMMHILVAPWPDLQKVVDGAAARDSPTGPA
jgi:hypothetical protein